MSRYEINVAKLSKRVREGRYDHFFATHPRSCVTMDQCAQVYKELVKAFPEPHYRVDVTYIREVGMPSTDDIKEHLSQTDQQGELI